MPPGRRRTCRRELKKVASNNVTLVFTRNDEAAHAQRLPCASPAQALFAPTATVKDASSHETKNSHQAPEHQDTQGTRHQNTKTQKLGTVRRLRFLAPDGSASVAPRIVVVVARWAQPVALLELHGGAVHVVARLPPGEIVIAANRAFPVSLPPLLLAIDRHRSDLHRYK